MRILFINPPQSAKSDARHSNLKIPLGFLYMAGVLEKNGFEVKIVDCPVHYKFRRPVGKDKIRIGLYPSHIKRIIEEFKPEIVGVSCAFTMYEDDSFEIIDLIKRDFPETLVVVGGAHSSANPEYVLRNKNIDLVVIGEGEETMLEIAQKFRDNKKIGKTKGIAWRDGKKIAINPPREPITNLDALEPAWHLINFKNYFEHPENSSATMRRNSVDVITSRGCPGNCVFCSIKTVWGRKWRARSPKNVVDEIEMLYKKYGVRQFRFQDDNLTLDKKRVIEICNEIVKRGIDIKWDTPNGIALWTLDREILTKMKQAGCYRVTFGVESACGKTQKYIGKVIDLKHITEMVNFCHKIGLWVCATFIIGFPDEKPEEIMETEKFILNSRINFPFVYVAQPYQGTRMYEDFKKLGLLNDFLGMSNIGETKYDTMHMKSDELNRILGGIYKKFYMSRAKSYLNPLNFYREFLSKIKSVEDLTYVIRMFKTVITL